MDVTDIGKVASRKRMNTDAEKLREKVSRETAKIIKLKVAQDTAYWDVQERLQQLAGAHSRLQQNMLDVQMQHEAASAAGAAERRLRAEALNRAAAARAVAAVLEEYGARLRRCVARAAADRAALGAASARAAAHVRALDHQLARRADALAAHRDAARESGARAEAAAQALAQAREQLGAARALAAERAAARDALAARLQHADAAAAALRDDVARLLRQLEQQSAHEQQARAAHHTEARAAAAEAARLRAEAAAAHDELRRAMHLLADANNTIDRMKLEDAAHVDKIQNLENVINDKNKHAEEMETEINSLKESVRQLEKEKLEVGEQLEARARECGDLSGAREQLLRDVDTLCAELASEQQQHREHAERDAASLAELRAAAAARQRELDASTGTIARLMTDLRAESDARARADAALAAARRAHDAELAAARDAARAQDDELAKQMTIILDMRAEKERLQERIQGMQSTIDNIQKELTGRPAGPKAGAGADEPEQDAGPHKPEPRHSELYSFLSDGSVDGDALDPREVGRRFAALARGGGLRAAPGAGDGNERLHAAQGSISLSQVKDDFKMKNRSFFKNKRFDSKPKKIK